jgi:hypothetical protein
MRFWSDLEIDCSKELRLRTDEISEAAYEAIEQAAGEAAKAAMLANLEREVALLRQAQQWRNESEIRQQELTDAKKAGRKNTLIAAVIGILGGLALGVGGTIIIGGR